MLTNLLIKNYTLIEHLELSPDARLNIITGETGAGKSIMLGAIGLLMGNRADGKVLFNPEEKCVIEGVFDTSGYEIRSVFEDEDLEYDPTCLVRREISTGGKSRAFVNDTPVNLETLRRVTVELMDIHSQHDTLLLAANAYQLQIVDVYARNQPVLARYKEEYRLYRLAREAYEKMRTEALTAKQEFDFNSFLLEELRQAKLEDGEEERLEQELQVLENAEEVKLRLHTSAEYLTGAEQSILNDLRAVKTNLNAISDFSELYHQLLERIDSCLIELKDVADEIEGAVDEVEFDNEKIEQIKERLSLVYHLQQKHQRRTVAELLELQESLAKKVHKVLNLDEELAQAKAEVDQADEEMRTTAGQLSESRHAVLSAIEEEIRGLLTELGMPNASLKITSETGKPAATGVDTIQFLFSANKGVKPQPLKNVASGGEFSRLLLAIKYILADKRSLPTIIFDEIDTGVSGEIAIQVGGMMRTMSRNHQIIAITHLHQIAGKGDAHYFVYKDNSSERTISRVRALSEEERVWEIAKMIGGSTPSESALKNARELLHK
ncbi:MAG: DNA repair protein RecN [Ferruginibacter sp.]|nr:DNA repair protein RecN [Cytophagales bacterium]